MAAAIKVFNFVSKVGTRATKGWKSKQYQKEATGGTFCS